MKSPRPSGARVLDALVALIVSVALVADEAAAAGSGGGPPGDREGRRRWALARMDEMAQERLRCRERFRAERQVRECEEEFARRHRAYNQVYLEALRE